MAQVKIEAAKSGKSSCKVCKRQIACGELRVGKPYVFKGNITFGWHHIECSAEIIKDENLSDIEGLECLSADLQQRFQTLSTNTNSECNVLSGVYVLELNNDQCFYVGKASNIQERVEQHKNGAGSAFVKAKGGVKRVLTPDLPREESLTSWEQKETIYQMMKRGFNHVRGWEFTFTKSLTTDELKTIRTLIFGTGDLCRNCGNPGHFVSGCKTKSKAPWLKEIECLIQSNTEKKCPTVLLEKKSDVSMFQTLANSKKRSTQRRTTHKQSRPKKRAPSTHLHLQCGRCGRQGHPEWACFAQNDVQGNLISDDEQSDSWSSDDDIIPQITCFSCGNKGHYATNCPATKNIAAHYL